MQLMLPPDPDSHREMWIMIQMVTALARADGNTFVLLIILLILYVIARILIAVCQYLYQLYKARAFTPNPHQHLYRIALMLGAGLGGIGLLLMAMPGSQSAGQLFLCYVFALFSLASAVLDWYTRRQAREETPTLEGLSSDDVLEWQEQVNDAYDKGLVV